MISIKPVSSLEKSSRIFEELIGVGALLSIALILGGITALWGLAFFVAFSLYLGRNLFYFLHFLNLVRSRALEPSKAPFGVWGDIYDAYFEKVFQDKRKLKRLRLETEQVYNAMNLLPDAHISLNEKLQIEWVNNSAESLLGLRQNDAGHRIGNLLRQREVTHYLEEKNFDKSVEFYLSAESTRRLSAKIVPYFDKHYLLIIRDITDAHNLAQIRRDFVANASHELRTPLTVLNGYLELMLDSVESLPPVWSGPLTQMHQQSLRMQNIINDLLTLSNIEAEGTELEQDFVDVPIMLRKLEVEANQLSNGHHQLHFHIESKDGLVGKTEALRSVFINLVSNAIRYTPEQGEIWVRWYQTPQSMVFEVKDTGIGIAREHIPRLTERFYRVDTARSRSSGGTGLGLAIVKHILERHQAKLSVYSRLQVGSTFRVEFPLYLKKSVTDLDSSLS
ncbi:phosphate regulon sensor histidine kinase PhoR [Thiomicrospira microaerophila]|uniref:phosphate regulon sensor histidine kinase PhoR n=1 Tax=Thiomicrospira microaerophila TaxID=406020 RepID=UPI00200D5AE8|nr:phosphate regulon sensor histidine kinase PhoR [Thiomicrospira microaerophila]UQB43119.1 phosphate regulon sensor histidine kinase PhoR [Thiomicrospira microaerophila]